MQRITITIDDDLLEVVDALTRQRGYESRSEAFRDIVREMASREQAKTSNAPCIAVLSYVFDYGTRDLALKLTRMQHEHHDMFAGSTRVPLDHTSCLEASVLHGPAQAIQVVADEISTQRGVRHANLHVIPVRLSARPHSHEEGGPPHQHMQA